MTGRERVLRAIEFRIPDRVPLMNSITAIARQRDPAAVEDYLRKYPGDFAPGGERYLDVDRTLPGEQRDKWGCVWRNERPGIIGQVVRHPLADWSDRATYRFPEPKDLYDFSAVPATLARNAGRQFSLGPGSWLWQRMFWLRGFENLLCDIADERDEVIWLRDNVLRVQKGIVESAIAHGFDGIFFLDDWGTQSALMIRPDAWRRIFKEAYRELFALVHSAGKKVFFHSDGHVLPIVDDLIEIGADVLNLQVGVMDEEKLAAAVRRRATILGGLDLQGDALRRDPDTARAHVRALLDRFAASAGGYIGQVIMDEQVGPRIASAIAETIVTYDAEAKGIRGLATSQVSRPEKRRTT